MGTGTTGIYSERYITLAADETLLKADPARTALIMRVAISARFLSVFPPKDLLNAAKRIGLSTTAELVTAFAIRSAFDAPSGELKDLLLDSYRKSTTIAVLSYFLADKVSKLNPGKAMLAGLMQDIALPPILFYLSERPEISNDPKPRTEAVDHLAPLVGALILNKWGLNKEMIETVRSRKQWMRDRRTYSWQ